MVMKENHNKKVTKFVFFLQTSNLDPNKQKHKSKRDTLFLLC